MNYSEFRQDSVSGDWILIAPGRRKRLHNFLKAKAKRKKAPRKGCPFENPKKSGQSPPFLTYGDRDGWHVQVFENKYPALIHGGTCATIFKKGMSRVTQGIGHQDLVVTADHNKNFSHLDISVANEVFQAFRDRYVMLGSDPCITYISIFQNWGPTAGASIYHPHYQIIGLPIVPPDVAHSLGGSLHYFKKQGRCVHCDIVRWEKKEKKRIIYENKGSIAVAPFISRTPFELRIIPKKHTPFFEEASPRDLESIVETLQKSLLSLYKNLNDPDYNFFIHTSPVLKRRKYRHYHWHIEVLPKISIPAGFELGTGIDINVVDPDEAASMLKVK